MKKAGLEGRLAVQLDALKIPYKRNVRFLVDKYCWHCYPETPSPLCVICRGKFKLPRYELDFHLTSLHQVGIEVQGGVWSRGAHGRGSGIVRDIHKQQLAIAMGWRIIPVTADGIKSGLAILLVKRMMEVM